MYRGHYKVKIIVPSRRLHYVAGNFPLVFLLYIFPKKGRKYGRVNTLAKNFRHRLHSDWRRKLLSRPPPPH